MKRKIPMTKPNAISADKAPKKYGPIPVESVLLVLAKIVIPREIRTVMPAHRATLCHVYMGLANPTNTPSKPVKTNSTIY